MINRSFINFWSKKYDKQRSKRGISFEQRINKALSKIASRGSIKYITKDILSYILKWKSPRIGRYADKNSDDFVRETSSRSFSTYNEQFRIESLTLMEGVGYRAASVILHFCFPQRYIVMDFRAWRTLQKKKELAKSYNIQDDFDHWQKYLMICQRIAVIPER